MKAKTLNLVSGTALTLVAGFMTAINPSPAYADDTKNYPGLMCYRAPGSGGRVTTWGSSIGNAHNSDPLDILCPVIKDARNNGIGSGRILAWDAHRDQDIECTLFSKTWSNGGFSTSAFIQRTLGAFSQAQTRHVMDFGGVTAAGPEASYYYQCRIPPTFGGLESSIFMYSVSEIGVSDGD